MAKASSPMLRPPIVKPRPPPPLLGWAMSVWAGFEVPLPSPTPPPVVGPLALDDDNGLPLPPPPPGEDAMPLALVAGVRSSVCANVVLGPFMRIHGAAVEMVEERLLAAVEARLAAEERQCVCVCV